TILWLGIGSFILTIFFSWGMQRTFQQEQENRNNIAVVNGDPININDFYQRHNQQATQFRSSLGGAFSSEMEDSMKPLVLRDMIHQMLLFQEAKKLGVVVTAEEVKMGIKSDPSFRGE